MFFYINSVNTKFICLCQRAMFNTGLISKNFRFTKDVFIPGLVSLQVEEMPVPKKQDKRIKT